MNGTIGGKPMPKTREEAMEILAGIEDAEKREEMRKMLDFFRPWEALDPELARYRNRVNDQMEAIQHPLVYAVPYMPGMEDGRLNGMLRQKKKVIAEYEAEGNFSAIISVVYERAYRLDALLRYAERIEDDCNFWDTVGGVWTDSENIHQSYDEWQDILHTLRPRRECIMDEDEREALAALPDTLKVYRGVRALDGDYDGLEGFSWTLDRSQAVWFARRWAGVNDGETAVVYTGKVAKADVIAYFSGRGEKEIVALPEHVRITRRQEV